MFRKFVVLPEKGEDQSYGVALIKSRKSPDKSLRIAINAIAYVKSNDIVLAELLFDTSSASVDFSDTKIILTAGYGLVGQKNNNYF